MASFNQITLTEYLFIVITAKPFFPYSWLPTRYLTRITSRVTSECNYGFLWGSCSWMQCIVCHFFSLWYCRSVFDLRLLMVTSWYFHSFANNQPPWSIVKIGVKLRLPRVVYNLRNKMVSLSTLYSIVLCNLFIFLTFIVSLLF